MSFDCIMEKRTFKKFSFRGVNLDALSNISTDDLVKLLHCPCSYKEREAAAIEKPAIVWTHLRNMIIVPEMIGGDLGADNGKQFRPVEIKPEMIGHYLAEFSISYKTVKHGRPDIGATHSSRFIPLK